MNFIGQGHIMRQLQFILPHIYENDVGVSLLLRGPSGWGKTRMAFMICNYLAGSHYEYCLGDDLKFSHSYRVHFIDECHLLSTPEVLYPIMDSGRYIILLATNDVAVLPEALVNRCYGFNFSDYTTNELRDIASNYINGKLKNESLDYLIECGGRNPRVIKSLASRLNMYTISNPSLLTNMPFSEFRALIRDVFDIEDGLDTAARRYIQILKECGGTASLQTISNLLHMDQSSIKAQVEPILLYKNLIKITSKGRNIVC